MKIKKTAFYFVTIFVLVLVVSALVTYLYSLIVHSNGIVNWETSFQLSIIFGVILAWINYQDKKENKNRKED